MLAIGRLDEVCLQPLDGRLDVALRGPVSVYARLAGPVAPRGLRDGIPGAARRRACATSLAVGRGGPPTSVRKMISGNT